EFRRVLFRSGHLSAQSHSHTHGRRIGISSCQFAGQSRASGSATESNCQGRSASRLDSSLPHAACHASSVARFRWPQTNRVTSLFGPYRLPRPQNVAFVVLAMRITLLLL